ncbi:hypothetical protein ABZ436_09645 [Micromonospora matsumotoense]|uniref:hypothetical protein n=1 Tax=Micromonospora matsumotoense TaxID=121616 RepID=UPI0033DE625D
MSTVAAIILGWNPQRWNGWTPSYEALTPGVSPQCTLAGSWTVGRRVNIPVGADAWLLMQGRQRGLVGHGVVTRAPYPGPHDRDPGATTNYVDVAWDGLLPVAERIDPQVLKTEASGVAWDYVFSSGTGVPTAAEAQVHQLWQRYALD